MIQGVVNDRIRWGKHGGFNQYSKQEVLDALVHLHESGVFVGIENLDEGENLKAQLTASNRAKGAAEARAIKYKALLDTANTRIEELTIALEESTQIGRDGYRGII